VLSVPSLVELCEFAAVQSLLFDIVVVVVECQAENSKQNVLSSHVKLLTCCRFIHIHHFIEYSASFHVTAIVPTTIENTKIQIQYTTIIIIIIILGGFIGHPSKCG